jgi:hypothetical protein
MRTPKYKIGDFIYFTYFPREEANKETGEVTLTSPEYPGRIYGIAHSFPSYGPSVCRDGDGNIVEYNANELRFEDGSIIPRIFTKSEHGYFFYAVEFDLEAIAILELPQLVRTIKTADGRKIEVISRNDIIREEQITGEGVEF